MRTGKRSSGSVAAALCSALTLCGCASQPLTHGIPNFAQVEPGLYRGGQPTLRGWQYLKSIGVTNVVKLNENSEGNDAEAQALGMHVVLFPISPIQQTIGKPSAIDLRSAVESMEHRGTFVHCTHGQDRTGLVVALYRVQLGGWPRRAAEVEMMAHGFHPWLRGLYWAWQEDVP